MVKVLHRLTPLEEYFLLEDRRAYPWSFFVRLEFAGQADPQAAHAALVESLSAHPLLTAIVERDSRGIPYWRTAEGMVPHTRWCSESAGEVFPAVVPIDIAREIGVKMHGSQRGTGSRIVFEFHHACCDARGAFRFVDDWLAVYASATGGATGLAPAIDYDPQALAGRGKAPPAPRHPFLALKARGMALLRAWRFLAQRPHPLLDYEPARDEEPTPAGFPAARHGRLDEAATASLRALARSRGVTLNDQLCCDLFRAIEEFQRQSGRSPSNPCIRLVLPADLRTAAHARMSAANLVSLVFLTRRADACRDADALLRGINQEMQQVKSLGLMATFFQILGLRRSLPGGLSRSVRRRRCEATAGLTNAGELLKESRLPAQGGRLVAGNLLLESADFLAPIRPLTCICISACTYAGRLTLNMQYDRRALSEEDADRLHVLYMAKLRDHVPRPGP